MSFIGVLPTPASLKVKAFMNGYRTHTQSIDLSLFVWHWGIIRLIWHLINSFVFGKR